MLPQDLDNRVRVLAYGYNSKLLDPEAKQSLAGHAEGFLNDLQSIRNQKWQAHRPIILIGHSLGCLIVKQALVDYFKANGSFDDMPVASAVFFEAPHRGLETKAMEDIMKKDPSAFSQGLINELVADSPTLHTSSKDFARMVEGLPVLTCYETRETPTLREVGIGFEPEYVPELSIHSFQMGSSKGPAAQ